MVVEVVGRARRPWVRKLNGQGMRGIRMGLMNLLWVRMLWKMEVRGLVVKVRLCGKNRNGDSNHAMPTRTSSNDQSSYQYNNNNTHWRQSRSRRAFTITCPSLVTASVSTRWSKDAVISIIVGWPSIVW
jgi:hypothetical protein